MTFLFTQSSSSSICKHVVRRLNRTQPWLPNNISSTSPLTSPYSHLARSAVFREAWRANQNRYNPEYKRHECFIPTLSRFEIARGARHEFACANANISSIVRILCYPLCTYLHAKLPRELRDIVYIQLLDSLRDSRTVHVTQYSAGCSALTLDPMSKDPTFCAQPHNCRSGICSTHFLNEWYVGGDVRSEIAEMWLRSTEFYFDEGWSSLGDLLYLKSWGLHSVRGDYISKIEIRIDGSLLKTQCLGMLGCLQMLRPFARVTLFVDFESSFEWGSLKMIDSFERALEMLWEWIGPLAESQLQINVWCDDEDNTMLVHGGPTVYDWVKMLYQVSLESTKLGNCLRAPH
jgi:hypothetical protein